MTTSVTRPYFTTQHNTRSTCKTKTKTDFFFVLRPVLSQDRRSQTTSLFYIHSRVNIQLSEAKNYVRNTVTDERLTGQALMYFIFLRYRQTSMMSSAELFRCRPRSNERSKRPVMTPRRLQFSSVQFARINSWCRVQALQDHDAVINIIDAVVAGTEKFSQVAGTARR